MNVASVPDDFLLRLATVHSPRLTLNKSNFGQACLVLIRGLLALHRVAFLSIVSGYPTSTYGYNGYKHAHRRRLTSLYNGLVCYTILYTSESLLYKNHVFKLSKSVRHVNAPTFF